MQFLNLNACIMYTHRQSRLFLNKSYYNTFFFLMLQNNWAALAHLHGTCELRVPDQLQTSNLHAKMQLEQTIASYGMSFRTFRVALACFLEH